MFQLVHVHYTHYTNMHLHLRMQVDLSCLHMHMYSTFVYLPCPASWYTYIYYNIHICIYYMYMQRTLRWLLSRRISLWRVGLSHIALGVVTLRGRVTIYTLSSIRVCVCVYKCACVHDLSHSRYSVYYLHV